ncbi:MAG: DUF362 domain-containing protein [Candidatus Thorarchaeota archaeon]|jgi:uncharacterized protein (DUF362 family)
MGSSTEVAIAVKKTPREALSTALSKLTQPIPLVGDSSRVVIKPSILDPKIPGNTPFEVVRALVSLFETASEIVLVESDNPYRSVEDAYSELGYSDLASDKIKLLNLSNDALEQMEMSGHYFTSTHAMPRVLKHPLFLVNTATLKYRPEEGKVWGGIKNLYGLLPEVEKQKYHERLEDVLLDLLVAFRPNLTVIDLAEVVIGKRLTGQLLKVGGVVVGTDPVAVDSYCSGLLGVDPMKVDYLKRAADLGLGEALLDRIEVRGTKHQKQVLANLMAQ